MKKLTFTLLLSFCVSFIFAQWDNATGIQNTTSTIGVQSIPVPLSPLSINTSGDNRHMIHVLSPSLSSGSAGVYVEANMGGGADHVSGVHSVITSGAGYTYGVRASAYDATPSTAGRAYGVWGQAGNATDGANFGVVGRLLGDNSGTGILGIDDVNHTWSTLLPSNETWAGYFIGDVAVSHKLGIQSGTNPEAMLAVNTVGDDRHIIEAYSPSLSSGAAGVYVEADAGPGFDDHVSGVHSVIESGSAYTYGVRASAYTQNPSTAGRAYGVWGQAGNATDGTNFGVYGRLLGSNTGAAVIGVDDVNFSGSFNGIIPNLQDPTQTWAGYFAGNVEITERLNIGPDNLSTLVAAAPNSDYRLFVNGGIAAKQAFITTTLPWADYVFENDYDLLSLKEVATHIAEKGHLHKTPSAAQVAEDGGFEVGEMTINQQEKIEEIFLHLIEMEKKMDRLEAENEALKAAQK